MLHAEHYTAKFKGFALIETQNSYVRTYCVPIVVTTGPTNHWNPVQHAVTQGPHSKNQSAYTLHCSSSAGMPYKVPHVELVTPKKGTTMETVTHMCVPSSTPRQRWNVRHPSADTFV